MFYYHKKSKYNVFTSFYTNFGITLLVPIFVQKYQVDPPVSFLVSIWFRFFTKLCNLVTFR